MCGDAARSACDVFALSPVAAVCATMVSVSYDVGKGLACCRFVNPSLPKQEARA